MWCPWACCLHRQPRCLILFSFRTLPRVLARSNLEFGIFVQMIFYSLLEEHSFHWIGLRMLKGKSTRNSIDFPMTYFWVVPVKIVLYQSNDRSWCAMLMVFLSGLQAVMVLLYHQQLAAVTGFLRWSVANSGMNQWAMSRLWSHPRIINCSNKKIGMNHIPWYCSYDNSQNTWKTATVFFQRISNIRDMMRGFPGFLLFSRWAEVISTCFSSQLPTWTFPDRWPTGTQAACWGSRDVLEPGNCKGLVRDDICICT